MSEWPPPMDATTTWITVRLCGGMPVRVRRTRLWGQAVRVDAEGKVFCPYCCEMVSVDELGRSTNTHGVGLRRTGTVLLAMDGDDPAPREPSIRDLPF